MGRLSGEEVQGSPALAAGLKSLHPGPFHASSESSSAAEPFRATPAAPAALRSGGVEGFFAAAESELPPAPRLADVRRALSSGDR